jgi:phytoene dehydrogenase-like protein
MLKHDVKLICDDCKYEFILKAENIKNAEVKVNDQQLTLIYFTCPKCNKVYRVSLADARYFELRKDLEKTKKRIRRNHGSNNVEFAKTLNQMVDRKLQRLKNHTQGLNERFPGTFTLVVSENNHEENFIKYLP